VADISKEGNINFVGNFDLEFDGNEQQQQQHGNELFPR
jgi:hypothetical protein